MKKLSLLPFIECKYDDVAFSDCDPIKLTKWREKHLIAGGPSCQKTKNETKGCDASDFPPGNLNNTYFIIFIKNIKLSILSFSIISIFYHRYSVVDKRAQEMRIRIGSLKGFDYRLTSLDRSNP